ncbi:hypothetical protein DYB32_003874 [Aphanomyces invadans]|uniref:Uncharacterized protein n=1 Tax=Aphanomyces invadans TaxID=157072 RepID=A0A418AZB4_9STRA|nr:hypothetical protein DYB32_003874 [Aphanomyces invadans]
MSSPRRSTLTKPKPQPALPEVVQAKPERFVLSSGHDAHDLLNAAEAELKECSVRDNEETMPRSAVYRHAVHMTAVADLGVRIYNVGDHPREATDRIVVARRLSATPSTPHNKAKNNTGRRYVNEAQPRLMKNQKYIERDKEFL